MIRLLLVRMWRSEQKKWHLGFGFASIIHLTRFTLRQSSLHDTLHTSTLLASLDLLINYSDASKISIKSCYTIIYSAMKHSTTTLLFLCAPCVVVSSFTNTRGIIHSTRRQPSMPQYKGSLAPLLLHLQQSHDKDKSMKFDDHVTGAAADSSLYMPYDLLPPPVSLQQERVLILNWHKHHTHLLTSSLSMHRIIG